MKPTDENNVSIVAAVAAVSLFCLVVVLKDVLHVKLDDIMYIIIMYSCCYWMFGFFAHSEKEETKESKWNSPLYWRILIIVLTLTPNGWGIAHCEKQKFEVNSTFEAVTAGFYDTNIFPILGSRNRRRYLPYPVFDRQKVRYYGVFDETCPLSNTELRF